MSSDATAELMIKANLILIDGFDLNCNRTLEYDPYSNESHRYIQKFLSTADGKRADSDKDSDPLHVRNEIIYSSYIQELLLVTCQARKQTLSRYQTDQMVNGREIKVGAMLLKPIEMVYAPKVELLPNTASSFSDYNYCPFPIYKSIWYIVKEKYRFQIENLYNQLEDVLRSLLSLAIRTTTATSVHIGHSCIHALLDDYHSRLFNNYLKWCDYLGEKPFPWQQPPWLEEVPISLTVRQSMGDASVMDGPFHYITENVNAVVDSYISTEDRNDMQQMMYEIALFKLIWGESANLRHTPELLCWLFHWMVISWTPFTTQDETFLDCIRDVVQRIRDEQWFFYIFYSFTLAQFFAQKSMLVVIYVYKSSRVSIECVAGGSKAHCGPLTTQGGSD